MTAYGIVVVSDRGDLYLPGCLNSIREHVKVWAPNTVDLHIVRDDNHELGLAGAVAAAWAWALDAGVDYLLHVEEDFRFVDRCPLAAMTEILERYDRLAQVVLKRQPWSSEEKAAGGIIELRPHEYTDVRDGHLFWCETDWIFSLNPCLIPRKVLEYGWPSGNEAGMRERLVADGWRMAMFGRRDDPPRVEHVGMVRGQGWRL